MTEIVPCLHQFGIHELDELSGMDLIIDMGGIINMVYCQYAVADKRDEFKELLNTPVLSFEIDEVNNEPFRNHKNKLEQFFNVASVGAALIGLEQNVGTLCLAGQNRSGLMSAFILIANGYTSKDAVRIIKEKRMNALNNENIVRFIMKE